MSTEVDSGVTERTDRSYVDRLRSSTFLTDLLANRLAIVGLTIILAMVVIAIYARLTMDLNTLTQTKVGQNPSLASPSANHPFGTDLLGRDIFERVLYGASYALQFGAVTVLASTVIGVGLGVTAAYANDLVDNVIMRSMDVLLAFPPLLLALALIAILGNGLWQASLALAIVYTPRFARVVRGAGLKVIEEEYIEATEALGASNARIVALHVLPNCLAPITVQSTLNLGLVVLNLAGLSFLGFGPSAGMPSWGLMLSNGVNNGLLTGEWWWSFFPGLFLATTVLGFNLLGDAMRDALDPRMRDAVE